MSMPIMQIAVVVLFLFAVWLIFHILRLPPNLKQQFEFMYDHWIAYGWYVDSNNQRRIDVDGLIDAWLAMRAEEQDCTIRELLDEITLGKRNNADTSQLERQLEHIRQQQVGGF